MQIEASLIRVIFIYLQINIFSSSGPMFVEQIQNGLDLSGTAVSISAIFETSLEPGQQIQPHYHSNLEEIYYILLGNGVITIGDEQQAVSKGDVVYIPPHSSHTLLNTSNIPLRFVTVTVGISPQNKIYDAQDYII